MSIREIEEQEVQVTLILTVSVPASASKARIRKNIHKLISVGNLAIDAVRFEAEIYGNKPKSPAKTTEINVEDTREIKRILKTLNDCEGSVDDAIDSARSMFEHLIGLDEAMSAPTNKEYLDVVK